MDRRNRDPNAQSNKMQHQQVNRVNQFTRFSDHFDNQSTNFSTYLPTPGSMQNSIHATSDIFTNPQRVQLLTNSFEFPPANRQFQYEPPQQYFHPTEISPRMLNNNLAPSFPQPPLSQIPQVPTMYRRTSNNSFHSRFRNSFYPVIPHLYPPPMEIQPNRFNFHSHSVPPSPYSESYSRRNGDPQPVLTFPEATSNRHGNESLSRYESLRHYGINIPSPVYPQPKRTNESMFHHPESSYHTATSMSPNDLSTISPAACFNTQMTPKENEITNKLIESGTVCEENDFSCIVCQDLRKDVLIWPCRHLCVCQMCSTQISLCPLCRKPIERLITVFM